ncbi:hypothetical protein M413DRAFT_22986 [Hebeloma cylindrosporum]|uniref:Uncharacterized protein n=1 Tax=Hebeloma cylindrosporum TaxID=76867 RepID=A0A0C3CIE6_HEBCY|nr:hypothetical protein M413DRAFT_22986 [Hebeloma cylindrosporum h7]
MSPTTSNLIYHILCMSKVSRLRRLAIYWCDLQPTCIYPTLSRASQEREHHRKLDSVDVQLIKALFNQNPCLYLDELQDLVLTCRGINISVPTLLRMLPFFRKDVSIHALERNDMDRAIYMNRFSELVSDLAMVMFVDEAARNKKNLLKSEGGLSSDGDVSNGDVLCMESDTQSFQFSPWMELLLTT